MRVCNDKKMHTLDYKKKLKQFKIKLDSIK